VTTHKDLKVGQKWFVRLDSSSAKVQEAEVTDLHLPHLVKLSDSSGSYGLLLIDAVEWIDKTFEPPAEAK
jgi:hypothetical protein